MQWVLIILALVLAIPTYGISILILIVIMPYLSAKTRRDMFPPLIKKALKERQHIIVEDVFFEAAEKYGLDSENVYYHEKGIHVGFYELIDGEKTRVEFHRDPKGGVIISAENHDEAMENARIFLEGNEETSHW